MKVKTISQPFKVRCPGITCGKEITVIIPGGQIRGQYRCEHCGTIFEYDLTEETEKETKR